MALARVMKPSSTRMHTVPSVRVQRLTVGVVMTRHSVTHWRESLYSVYIHVADPEQGWIPHRKDKF